MKDPCEKCHLAWGLAEFRERFPLLRLTHLADCALQWEGELAFSAVKDGYGKIGNSYRIRGFVPARFPIQEAVVFETGGRIAKDYHRLKDMSLCLGSPIRIKKVMAEQPSLIGLVDRLIIPYLYNHSYMERHGTMPVGELEHGGPGLVHDYEELFRLKGLQQCLEALRLLGLKKRIANKRPCPCGSGHRLGRCHNLQLNLLRKLAPRNYFKKEARTLATEL